ncbi:hypothetical protein [Adhaeribacter arboris]|nr:hypothetical protein [Adhaeribacter arboris]
MNRFLQAENRAMEKSLPPEQIRLLNLEKYAQFSLKMCQESPAMWV